MPPTLQARITVPAGLYCVPIFNTSILISSAGCNTGSLTPGIVKTENQCSGSGSESGSTGSICFWIRIQMTDPLVRGMDPRIRIHTTSWIRNTAENSEKVQVTFLQSQSVDESARLFLQSFELAPPSPHQQASVAPPFSSKGDGQTHSHAGEGEGEPIRTKKQTHSGTPGTV